VVHLNVVGDGAKRLRAARYEQMHHVPTVEEEEQARMMGAVLVRSYPLRSFPLNHFNFAVGLFG